MQNKFKCNDGMIKKVLSQIKGADFEKIVEAIINKRDEGHNLMWKVYDVNYVLNLIVDRPE